MNTHDLSAFTILRTLGRESGIRAPQLVAIACLGVLASFFSTLSVQAVGGIVNTMGATDGQKDFFPILKGMYALFATLFGTPETYRIFVFALLYLLLFFAHTVFRNLFAYQIERCSNRLIFYIRCKCFARILHARREALSSFTSGDIVHRVMTDSTQVQFLFATPAYTLISDIVDILWISIFLLLIDWRIFIILATVTPVLIYCSGRAGIVQRRQAEKAQAVGGACTTSLHRMLDGLDNIKTFGGEEHESKKFKAQTDEGFQIAITASKALCLFFPLESMLRNFGIIAAVSYAAWLALQDVAALGTVPVVFFYAQRFYAPMGNWVRYHQVIQKGLASLRRLQDILELEQEDTSKELPLTSLVFPFAVHGGVRLPTGKNVDISLRMEKPGLALVRGKSGAGKTQFLKSLVHLGAYFEGAVTLAGQRLNPSTSLRRNVAYASQDGHFIEGTIAENIAYPHVAEHIDAARCQTLLCTVGLDDFALEHPVKEFGSNLSLGEQRRLMLCRGLYSERPILLLDEIDANVDPETRQKIYAAVRQAQKKQLVLMVTHAHEEELTEFSCQRIVVGG